MFTLKKLYFIWSNRDAEAFQWFAAVLGKIESHPAVYIRAFLTSSSRDKDDLNAFLLRIGMESQVEQGGADVVTSLKNVMTQYRRCANAPALAACMQCSRFRSLKQLPSGLLAVALMH